MSSRWRRLATVLGCLLLAAGCRIDIALDVDVNRNGAGEVRISFTADEEVLAQADERGIDVLGELAGAGEQTRGWRVTDEDADGARTVTLTRAFRRPDEFNTLMAELADGLAAPEGRLLEPFTITVDPETVRIEGEAALQPSEAVADYGLPPADLVRRLQEQEGLGYTVRVRMPGPVREATGDISDERDVVWRVAPGERVVVFAAADRPGGPVWPAVALGVGLVAVGMVVAVVAGRRRRGHPRASG